MKLAPGAQRVLGILTAVAACPAIVGTTEAIRQGQRQNSRERHRGRKSNITVACSAASLAFTGSEEVHGGTVVLSDNKLYVRSPGPSEDPSNSLSHPFEGYFLPFPEQNWGWKGEGLVSIINKERHLNWIYVDKDPLEVKYGVREQAENNIIGPWDCTKINRRMTLERWEGFMAVKEKPGVWALYFDQEDNGLKGKVSNRRILEIELTRKERCVKDGEEEGRRKSEKLS